MLPGCRCAPSGLRKDLSAAISAVDANVFLRQVAGEHAIARAPEPQRDPDLDLILLHGCRDRAFIVIGIPLAGLSFSLPGGGRIGFAVIAALWATGLLALRRSTIA